MGNLKPGVKYSYERKNGIVYAKAEGSPEQEAIGWDYDPRTEDGKPLIDELRDNKLWGEIKRSAKSNPLLQEALDRVIMIYHLSKNDGKE